MRHLFCTLRDRLLSLLLDPCDCPRCVADRDFEEMAEDLVCDAESYANRGWEL